MHSMTSTPVPRARRAAFLFTLAAGLSAALATSPALAHSHTHVGINADGISGTADDNQLWFFAMPGTSGWPNWGKPLEMVYQTSGPLAGYYLCEELYCWHSAHPENGAWQLGGVDPEVEPDWRIGIQRVAFDEGFFMVDFETFMPVLSADGEVSALSSEFMDDKINENGELGAWGFHAHQYFVADAEPGEILTATFRAVDLGATGYATSDEYAISFITVPEPAALTLLALGLPALIRRKR